MSNFVRLIRTQWDRAWAVVLVAAGLLSLLLGWIGMSGTVLTFQQLPYLLSGGLFGLALITVGAALWLSADVRDEWRKIDRLEAAIERAGTREPAGAGRAPEVPANGGTGDHAAAGDGQVVLGQCEARR